MSHVAKMQLQVKNLKALAACLAPFGAELIIDQKQFEFYGGAKQKCDHAIRVKGTRYEIGLTKQSDGSFDLQCDFWSSGGLGQRFGNQGEKLKQAYAVSLARQHYGAQGYLLNVVTKENGDVVITATK